MLVHCNVKLRKQALPYWWLSFLINRAEAQNQQISVHSLMRGSKTPRAASPACLIYENERYVLYHMLKLKKILKLVSHLLKIFIILS